eukprot:6182188-Pleurochrysis_carterae.AAC.3
MASAARTPDPMPCLPKYRDGTCVLWAPTYTICSSTSVIICTAHVQILPHLPALCILHVKTTTTSTRSSVEDIGKKSSYEKLQVQVAGFRSSQRCN